MVPQKTAGKIVIVEPHSDDAWLGMGGFILLNPDKEFLIITVSITPKNYNKSFLLAKFGNIKNICYGYKNLEKWDFEKESDMEKIWERKNRISFQQLVERIRKDSVGASLYLPQGYRDALHNLISRIDGDGYYREIPYYWARKEWKGAKYIYRKYSKSTRILLSDDVVYKKWKIFDTIYRDQLGMFQFFRPYYKTIKDEVIFYE